MFTDSITRFGNTSVEIKEEVYRTFHFKRVVLEKKKREKAGLKEEGKIKIEYLKNKDGRVTREREREREREW